MQRQRVLVVVLALAVLWMLSVQMTHAAEPPAQANVSVGYATPLGTAFTYQGQLQQGGNPVNGTCDLRFGLWDALSGGLAVGSLLERPAVNVTNGLLSVADLDFGAAFAGDARWLEVAVRCPAGSGSYTTLAPRQALTPAPYAIYARNVPLAGSGSATTAARSDHNHWGQSWTSSSSSAGLSVTNSGAGSALSGASDSGCGVTGDSTASYGVYGTGGAVGVHGEGPTGVEGKGTGAGTGGHFLSAGGKAIQADGDVQVTGNLTVTGQISGFPRPSFDSGWVQVAQGTSVTITHSLGGDPEDYVVDMTFRDNYFGSGIHQITYGGDVRPDEGGKGVWWEALNATTIKAARAVNDARCQEVRIRIWVYQ